MFVFDAVVVSCADVIIFSSKMNPLPVFSFIAVVEWCIRSDIFGMS